MPAPTACSSAPSPRSLALPGALHQTPLSSKGMLAPSPNPLRELRGLNSSKLLSEHLVPLAKARKASSSILQLELQGWVEKREKHWRNTSAALILPKA